MAEIATTIELTEQQKVVVWRYEEARRYGFTRLEARMYADSEIDSSELRRLKRSGWPPARAAAFLLT